jgi:hypothetical protein
MQYILLNRGKKIFPTIWGIWVTNDAELNVDFQNINLYYRQNAPKKSKSRIKILFTTQGAPCVLNKIFFCVFQSFRWSSTYLCYIPFENAKKSKIGSPYCTCSSMNRENIAPSATFSIFSGRSGQ